MPRRILSRDEKLAAVKRMLVRENVVALARELNVSRKMLYDWRAKYLAGVRRRCVGLASRARR